MTTNEFIQHFIVVVKEEITTQIELFMIKGI